MSSLVKAEAGSGIQGRTFMKEVGKTEFTWTVENVYDFRNLTLTAVSPIFSVSVLGRPSTFHLELTFTEDQFSGPLTSYFLVKDQPGSLKIKVRVFVDGVDGFLFNKSDSEKLFEFSDKEKHFLCKAGYRWQKKINVKMELSVFEPACEVTSSE